MTDTRVVGTIPRVEARQRSAVVFGARNIGRAVIELLLSDGWAVTGVARSQSTLDGISAAGALACTTCLSRRQLLRVGSTWS